jgi:hypothetical protein
MTKVYDALLQAESERQQRTESPVSTDALFPSRAGARAVPPVPAGSQLERIREIMLGAIVQEFGHAVACLETRVAAEEAQLRGALANFERRLEDRLVEIDTLSCQRQVAMRQQILSHSSSLTDTIKERSADVVRSANADFEELRREKLTGAEFSTFLRGLAEQLDVAER